MYGPGNWTKDVYVTVADKNTTVRAKQIFLQVSSHCFNKPLSDIAVPSVRRPSHRADHTPRRRCGLLPIQ